MKYSYAQGCLLLGLHAGPAEMLRTKKKAVINTQLYTIPTVHCALESRTHTCNSLYSVARYDTIAPMFLYIQITSCTRLFSLVALVCSMLGLRI